MSKAAYLTSNHDFIAFLKREKAKAKRKETAARLKYNKIADSLIETKAKAKQEYEYWVQRNIDIQKCLNVVRAPTPA